MTTHTTLEAAQAAAQAAAAERQRTLYVLEIEHATEGRVYVVALVPAATLRRHLPAGIVRIVAEHGAVCRPRTLRERRHDIVAGIKDELDRIDDARERAYERDTGMGGIPSYDNPQVEALRAELAAFDREHPEVLAEIQAERREAAERARWN
jgi:hypothetical protein